MKGTKVKKKGNEMMKEKMESKNKQKGITLIALVVTIIVLLILAGISINALTGQNGILNRAVESKELTEIAQTEEAIKLSVMAALTEGSGTLTIENLKKELANNGITIPDNATFPVTVTTENSSYQIDQYGNVTAANWTAADSANTNDDWYAYKDNAGNKAQVNVPKLADGMTAIKYDTNEEVTGSKWANAMTKDGSMWVWIPRYAYKITYKNATDKKQGGTIDIAFLKGTTNEFLDKNITGELKTNISDVTYTTNNANGTKSQDQWLLEPAFTLGTDKIEGFWFAKFEASNTNGYGDDTSTANNSNLTLQIKPNATSWRNITSENIFTACLNLTSTTKYNTYFNDVSNVDTHMTKNVEWGAVAYLAHSKYGLNGEEICVNTNSGFKTGVGSGKTNSATSVTDQYNTPFGLTASTTKNVYGIYDMSGGANEYVAACFTGKTDTLTKNSDYINIYIDIYDSYSLAKFGDAVFETSSSSSGSNSWFTDYSNFVYSTNPVFKRGGYFYDGSVAGLFCFCSESGWAYNGFRPVCVVK